MVSNRDANVSKDEQDRISELPDPVLGEILSYLPTKNAVAASILSTRWKNVFPFELPLINIDLDDSLLLHPDENELQLININFDDNLLLHPDENELQLINMDFDDFLLLHPDENELDFDDSLLLHPGENEPEFIPSSFIDFVDKLLNETLTKVDTFTLKCKKVLDGATLKSWIGSIVRLSVQELQLKCDLRSTTTFFGSLDGCTTLTRLELNGEHAGGIIITLPDSSFSLPALRSLDLICIIFRYDYYQGMSQVHTLTTFINGCPGLEELYFTECYLEGISNLHIISPVLKTLSIHDSFLKSHFTLNIPNLQLLSLSNNLVLTWFIYPFNSLRSFHIDGESSYYRDTVRDLVYVCRKTKHLYFDPSSVEHFHYANKELSAFQGVTKLSFASLRSEGWVILAYILKNAPYLEQLTFEGKFEQSDRGFEDFERLVSSATTCLELNIKKIEFRHFDDTEDENKLLYYFIRKGKVLENVVVKSVLLRIR